MIEKFQRLLDRIESRWSLLILIGTTGFVSGLVARATAWLNAWGPIAWLAAALLGALSCSITYYIFITGYAKWQRAKEINMLIDRSKVNPLEDRFNKRSIFLPDLYDRDYVPHVSKSFKDCVLYGPAMIFIDGCTISKSEFSGGCQIVIVERGVMVRGVVIFSQCLFNEVRFSNVTILFDKERYDELPDELKDNIPVIS